MSWVQENKFLAGLAGVTVVGVGVLGYLVFQANSENAQARATYEEKSAELNRLQTLTPFPSAQNVKKLDEQRKKHAEAIQQLQQNLAKIELPLEDVSQQQFQDRLRTTVDSINQSASQNGVKRAESFTLGFDRYLSEPPRPEASSPLARQLKAIDILIKGMIGNRVAELRELKRDELPAEKGAPVPEPAAKGGKPSAGDKGGSGELLNSSTVEITFLADQASFKQVLNGIISNKEQFFIPRLVTVTNEKQEPPSRTVETAPAFAPAFDPAAEAAPGVDPAAQPQPGVDPAAAPAADPSAAAPGAPGAPAAPGAVPEPPLPGAGLKTIIVGDERIEVRMRIEIVDFAETPTTASK